jgi:hypothetical protein
MDRWTDTTIARRVNFMNSIQRTHKAILDNVFSMIFLLYKASFVKKINVTQTPLPTSKCVVQLAQEGSFFGVESCRLHFNQMQNRFVIYIFVPCRGATNRSTTKRLGCL